MRLRLPAVRKVPTKEPVMSLNQPMIGGQIIQERPVEKKHRL